MVHWQNQPPKDQAGYAHRIVRTPPDKPLTAIVTCTDVVGCATHFISNRTVPCEGPDTCSHCADGYSWRWHGYVSALDIATLEHFLFEFTKAAADTFRNYMTLHGNMRGCYFQAKRPSARRNGRVVIACKRIDEQRHRLPDPLNVRRILCHIWNVKYTDTQELHHIDLPESRVDVDDSGTDGRYRS